MEIAPLKKKKRESMYVRISWWYHLSERTFHYGFIVHLCVLSSPSTLLYFFFFWIALLHRRRTENIIGSGALGGLRGGGYGACIAPDIFMDLQHPNYSSNFDNLLPNTHFWHLFARFNSQRFDSTRLDSVSDFTKFDVLLSESKSVSCRLDCTQTNLVV